MGERREIMNVDGNRGKDPYFFLRLLIAYIQEHGEITIKAATLDKVRSGSRLIKTIDEDSVIHVSVLAPEHTEVYVLDDGKPANVQAQGGAIPATPAFEELMQKARSVVLDDSTLARLEAKRKKESVLRQSAVGGTLNLEKAQSPFRKTENE